MQRSANLTDFAALLGLLGKSEVEFIVVGGFAATLHGSGRLTQDLDIVYSRSDSNLERIVKALEESSPYLRGAPPGLPFRWDYRTLKSGLNFTLTTTSGDLDLLGHIAGGGGYEDLSGRVEEVELFGQQVKFLDLPTLLLVKRAAGRPKDLETLAELQSLLDEFLE